MSAIYLWKLPLISKKGFFDLFTLVCIRLDLSTFVYSRLVTRLHSSSDSSVFVYTRLHLCSESSVFCFYFGIGLEKISMVITNDICCYMYGENVDLAPLKTFSVAK